MRKIRCIVGWMLVVVCCIGIFYFSSEKGEDSHSRSGAIVKKVEKAITCVVQRDDYHSFLKNKNLEYVVRKTAHVSEYLLLTSLVFFALGSHRLKGKKRYVWAIIFTILYASLDEYHQYFVGGRDGQVKDVMIDSFGGSIGMMLCYMTKRVQRNILK